MGYAFLVVLAIVVSALFIRYSKRKKAGDGAKDSGSNTTL